MQEINQYILRFSTQFLRVHSRRVLLTCYVFLHIKLMHKKSYGLISPKRQLTFEYIRLQGTISANAPKKLKLNSKTFDRVQKWNMFLKRMTEVKVKQPEN